MLGATLLVIMAVLAFANVITRYVFEFPLAFTEEIEVNALVWLTLFGTACAFRRRRHLRMLFLQDKFSEKIEEIPQYRYSPDWSKSLYLPRVSGLQTGSR